MPARLPEGPAAGRVTQAVQFHRDPLRFLGDARREFGDVFTVRIALVGPMVVFCDRRAIPQIVASDPGRAHTGEARREIIGIVPPEGILGADGDLHRVVRERLQPLFTLEAIERHRSAMADIADRCVQEWPRGRRFELLPEMRTIMTEIVVRLILAVRDEHRAAKLVRAVRRMLWLPGNPPITPPGEGDGLVGALGIAYFNWRKRRVVELLREEIDERRAGGEAGSDVIGRLLDAVPPVSTEYVIDECITLLMPAHESGPTGLTWVLDRLGRHPDDADRFAASTDGDPRDEAFMHESLRLRPAVHSVVRRLKEPMEIVGHQLPAGVIATVPMLLVHRDPEAFPDPDTFRPERFIAGLEPDAPYLPFGGGPRRCLGEALAITAIRSVLPAVLRRVRVRPLSDEPERPAIRATVAVPIHGAEAVAVDR